MSYFIELNINGLGYILPKSWNPSDQSSFLVEDYQGNPTTVSSAVGAQIIAGSRAWTLLQTLFGVNNLEAAGSNWDTIIQQGGIVNALNALSDGLAAALGDTIALSIAPATIISATEELASEIPGATVKTIDLAEATYGLELAQRMLQNSYSSYLRLSYQVSNHTAVSYSNLQNSINQAICAMSLGQSMVSMISQMEGFSEPWTQSIVDYATSVSNAITGALIPLAGDSLNIANYAATLKDSNSDYIQIAESISEAAQLSVSGYTPMTGSGLRSIEASEVGLPFVHDGSTQPLQTTSPGPPANALPPKSSPMDGYGHSSANASPITANPVYQGVLDQRGASDWFSVYLIGGEAYRFALDGAPVDGLTTLASLHLYIVKSDGTTEVGDAPAVDGTAIFSLTAPSSGIYYLEVSNDNPATTGGYALSYADEGPSSAPSTTSLGLPPPSLTLTTNDYEVSELAQVFHFEVETSTPLSSPVTIQWTVTGNGAHPANASDFQATSGTLTLEPGAVDHYGFNVVATDNGTNEFDQNFVISMSVISGAANVSGSGLNCVILNSNAGAISPSAEPPNLDLADATLMAINSYSNGYIVSAHDEDYYRFDLSAGATYQIAAFGTSQLQSWSSPSVSTGYQALLYPEATLYDSNGNVLVQNLPVLSGVPSEVSEMFTPGSSGYYYLGVSTEYQDGLHNGEYAVLTDLSVPSDDYEGNASTSGAIQVGATTTGDIERPGDSDWFRVNLAAGQTYDAYALATGGGTSGGSYYWQNLVPLSVSIFNSQGSEVAGPAFPSGAVTQNVSQFFATQTGVYYVSVAGTYSYITGTYIVGVAGQAPDPSGITPTTLQPNAGDSLEAWANGPLGSAAANTNASQIFVGDYSGNSSWGAALEFDVEGLAKYAAAAYIELYSPSTTENYEGIVTGIPLKSWSQQSPLDATNNISFEDMQPVADAPGWYSIDITELYNEWQAGSIANYGVQLFASNGGSSAETFDSEANANAALRPKLVIYTAPVNTITVNALSNDVMGSDGPDDIIGSLGNDYINGGGGDDVIGGGPSDTIDGGSGFNAVTYVLSPAPVSVDLTTNEDHGGFAEDDVLSNIEEVIGSNYNDQLVAGPAATKLYGGSGNDTLIGGPSNDYLAGGPGTDTAKYDVLYADATVTRNADGSWTISTSTGGVDTLVGVERAEFLDRTVSMDAATVDSDDFNGDGRSDILFLDSTGTFATWQMSDTAITGGGNVGNPGGTYRLTGVGDFNGDGYSDILFRNGSGTLATWQTNGTAIVGGGSLGNLGSSYTVVGVGDFNGDGLDDILFRNTVTGGLATWDIDGTSIVGGGNLGNPGAAYTVEGIGDFNGDGMSDILFRNANGTYAIWEMNDTAIAASGTIGDPGPGWSFKGIGDFSGDGMSDILFENTQGSYATWDMNGLSIVGGGNLGNPGPTWSLVGIGDYNGDGKSDLLFENTSGTFATWDLGDTAIIGGGNIGNPGSTYTIAQAPAPWTPPVVVFKNAGGDIATWEVNGTTIIGGGNLGIPASGLTAQAFGDFNGDGGSDIAFQAANGAVTTWQTDGAQLTGGAAIGNPGSNWTLLGAGDFNGDGKDGLLFENTSGVYATWDLSGTTIIGGGTLGTAAGFTFEGIGDFNGDGQSDVLFLNKTTGVYASWDLNDTAIVGGGNIGNPGTGWTFKGIGDFVGDGKDSIVFENASGTYATWDLNDTSIVGGGTLGAPGGSYTFAGIADLNGDGKDDILFKNAAGTYASWELSDTSIIGGGTIGAPGGTYAFLETGGDHTPHAMVQAMASFNIPQGATLSTPPLTTSMNLTPNLAATVQA